jgi:hypothetical protein
MPRASNWKTSALIGINAKPVAAVVVTFMTASRRGLPKDRASDRGMESNFAREAYHDGKRSASGFSLVVPARKRS